MQQNTGFVLLEVTHLKGRVFLCVQERHRFSKFYPFYNTIKLGKKLFRIVDSDMRMSEYSIV